MVWWEELITNRSGTEIGPHLGAIKSIVLGTIRYCYPNGTKTRACGHHPDSRYGGPFVPLEFRHDAAALYPANLEQEKISFRQLNKSTSHRITSSTLWMRCGAFSAQVAARLYQTKGRRRQIGVAPLKSPSSQSGARRMSPSPLSKDRPRSRRI
jgi:hypothetical protein